MKQFTLVLLLFVWSLNAAFANGPYPQEQMGWTDEQKQSQRKAGEVLRQKIYDAAKKGEPVVDIPKGVYRFYETEVPNQPTHFNLTKASNLSINGNGSLFVFERQASAFRFLHCSNITLKNLQIDYDPLPYVQGTIVAINDTEARTFDFRPDPGYGMPELLLNKKVGWAAKFGGKRRLLLWDRKTGLIKSNQLGLDIDSADDAIVKLPNGDYRIKTWVWWGRSLKEAGFEIGGAVTCWKRFGRTIRMEICENINMQNITVYSGGYIAFVGYFGAGPINIENCHLQVRPDTNRLMSINADGYNIRGILKGAKIINCTAEAICDDAINLQGVYYKVFKQNSPTELLVAKTRGEDCDEIVWHFIQGDARVDPSIPGAKNLKTWKYIGKRKVVKKELVKYTFPQNKQDHQWAAAENFVPGKEYDVYKVELDEPIAVNENSYFWGENEVVRGSVIKGNRFHNILARGIRLQSIDCVVENNDISYTTGPSLTLAGQPGYWGESTNSQNVIIRNNIFKDSGRFGGNAAVVMVVEGDPTLAEPIKDITFENNQIINPRGSGIELAGCENVLIKGNSITGLRSLPPHRNFSPNELQEFPHYGEAIIEGAGLKNVKIEGNTID